MTNTSRVLSTIDNIYILHPFIQIIYIKGKKVDVAFMDYKFRKAFDYIVVLLNRVVFSARFCFLSDTASEK